MTDTLKSRIESLDICQLIYIFRILTGICSFVSMAGQTSENCNYALIYEEKNSNIIKMNIIRKK